MIFTNEPFPYGAAGTNRVLSYCYGFIQNGKDVILISISPASGKKDELLSVWPCLNNIKYFALSRNKRVCSKITNFIHRQVAKIYFPMILFFKVNKKKCDAVIFYGQNAYFERLLKLFCKRNNALFLCEISEHPYAITPVKEKVKPPIEEINKASKIRYNGYDCMLAMTNPLLAYLKEIGVNNEMLLIPQTIIQKRFEHSQVITGLKYADYIAFTGHFSNEKDGVLYLLQAYAFVKIKHPSIKLIVAGFGSSNDLMLIKSLINKLNIDDSVQLIINMKNSEIPSLITNAKLLVSTRPYSLQSEYGFPTKVTEYLASGIPVVTTAFGDLKTYLVNKKNAFILESVDAIHIADTINSVLDNYDRAKQVGEKGKELVEQYFNPRNNVSLIIDYITNNSIRQGNTVKGQIE